MIKIRNEIKDSNFQTEQQCIDYVTQSNRALLGYIPENKRTFRVCEAALNNNVKNIKYIPEGILTKDMTIYILKEYDLGYSYIFDHPLGKAFLKEVNDDIDFWQKVIKIMPIALRHIPKNILNEDLSKTAFYADPYCLRYVPDEYIDEKMCFIAISNNFKNIKYIPKHFRTSHLEEIYHDLESHKLYCKNKFNIPPYCFNDMPEEYIDEKMCFIAISNDFKNIRYIPKHFRTSHLEKIYSDLMSHDLFCLDKVKSDLFRCFFK